MVKTAKKIAAPKTEPTVTKESTEESKIEFFGQVDRDRDGKPVSYLPAWMLPRQKEELEEEIARNERTLKVGAIPGDQKGQLIEDIRRSKKRLDEINESMPSLTSAAKDKLAKAHEEIGGRISESLFTRDEMRNGFADPHEEHRRNKQPCIKMDPDLARACNVRITSGKVSRDGANKIYKIIGARIGENTNPERLRKDRR